MSDAKVFLVDDDESFCSVVTSLLKSVKIQAETFYSPKDFLKAFEGKSEHIHNACVILDMRLPEISGLDVLEKITADPLCPPVIMLTAHADVPSAVRAMKSGAFDFIEKPFSGQSLVDLVQKAIDADRAKRGKIRQTRTLMARLATLSKREREVLDLVVAGKASKQIAEELGISIHTVDNHRAHIMSKMHTDSLADLVRAAVSAKAKGP